MSYKIVRKFYKSGLTQTIKKSVSLEEAQAHCKDPESSSSTCTNKEGEKRTRKFGAWFDLYYEEPK